jgi:hypothetical protein
LRREPASCVKRPETRSRSSSCRLWFGNTRTSDAHQARCR